MDAADRAAREYLAVVLRLGRLVPALVEAATADRSVYRAVAAEPVPSAAELVGQAGELAQTLPDAGLDPARERFLTGQLQAVEWRARRLAGQHVPFSVEVAACLGVTAVPGESDVYRAAHRELDALLPGSGPLRARLADHHARETVAPDRLRTAVQVLTVGLRERSAARYRLPPAETVDPLVVHDAPWSALHVYRGGFRSTVRFNAGARPGAGRLARLVAHETYPGHHVECVRHELAYVGGRVELGATVLGSPWTVLSEGLAECALDTAVGPGWGRWAQELLAVAGVGTDGRLAERLDTVREVLRRARLDAALLLHGRPGAAGRDAAEAHLRQWLLLDDARARRVAGALARPLWRTQVVASVEGAKIVRSVLDRAPDPVAQHLRLLDDLVLPDAVRSRTSTQRRKVVDGR